MLRFYFTPRNADGTAISTQTSENGTDRYEFDDVAEAFQRTPPGGFVEKRYTDGKDDLPGGITARKPK